MTGRLVAAALDGSTIRANCATDPAMAALALRAELQQVCQSYTSTRADGDDQIFDEMASFVILSFPEFAMSEIREAFRLAADGTTDTDESDLKAYFGVWTVASLGIILRAYKEYRNTIVAKFKQIESETRALSLPVTTQKAVAEYEDERVGRLKYDPAVIVTVNDFSILRKKNLLNIEKDDWQKLLGRAIDRISIECLAVISGGGGIGEKTAARADLTDFESGQIRDDLWARVQAEAKRIAVGDWIGDKPF